MTRQIDIEDEVRKALVSAGYLSFCKPLPKNYEMPCILVTATGGTQIEDWHGIDMFDNFIVKLDARGNTADEALLFLRSAIGALQSSAFSKIAKVTVNSIYSWGADTARPDIALCSSTLTAKARPETF